MAVKSRYGFSNVSRERARRVFVCLYHPEVLVEVDTVSTGFSWITFLAHFSKNEGQIL
jgi:hypothetical protein